MINSIGKHSHNLHIVAAKEASREEDVVETPPTILEKTEAREAQKSDEKNKKDVMRVLINAESMQRYGIISEKPGMDV
jgi:hypothetical protein